MQRPRDVCSDSRFLAPAMDIGNNEGPVTCSLRAGIILGVENQDSFLTKKCCHSANYKSEHCNVCMNSYIFIKDRVCLQKVIRWVPKHRDAKLLHWHNIETVKIKNSNFQTKYFINALYRVFICKVFHFCYVYILLRSWVALSGSLLVEFSGVYECLVVRILCTPVPLGFKSVD